MPSNSMEYEINEILNIAIMTNIPNLIVEGDDDLKFYADLSEKINKAIEVFAIENISGYSEGCDSVIKAMRDIANISNPPAEYCQYILGIIDRDARHYRSEIPEDLNNLLLVLKFYSYESHFITEYTIAQSIAHLTNAPITLAKDSLCINWIETKLINQIDELYYCSLEALKSACDSSYTGALGYSAEAGRIINDSSLINQVLAKKDDLDEYARIRGISKDKDNIKLIAKGKWLLQWFVTKLLKEINGLPNLCKNGVIKKCQFCTTENFEKCLYRKGCEHQVSHLKKFVIMLYDEPELNYIKDRIQLLV